MLYIKVYALYRYDIGIITKNFMVAYETYLQTKYANTVETLSGLINTLDYDFIKYKTK